MRTRRLALLALTALALMVATAAMAGTDSDIIYRLYHYEGGAWVRYYAADPLPTGGNQPGTNLWKYEYTVKNKAISGTGINTVWLFFNSDNVLCSTFSAATLPDANWTATRSGPISPNNNWKERFRTTVTSSFITLGNQLGGFAIEFTWVCNSVPGAQNYDAVYSGGSESSVTIEEEAPPVPVESSTWSGVKALYR